MPKKKEREGIDINNLINSAVQEGIEAIMEHHPKFREHQEYFLNSTNF